MDNDEFWTNFTALLPNGVETTPRDEECTVKWNDKELNIIRNDNSFVIISFDLYANFSKMFDSRRSINDETLGLLFWPSL